MTTLTRSGLVCTPLLDRIRDQAEAADQTRNLDADLIGAIKASDMVRLSATEALSGVGASVLDIGRELEAVAPACGSTAWVLWNHLCVFHEVVGQLGPVNEPFLRDVVANRGMVSFPDGRTDGRADGRTGGRTGGQADGRTDIQKHNAI